jgi:hypothetical protein
MNTKAIIGISFLALLAAGVLVAPSLAASGNSTATNGLNGTCDGTGDRQRSRDGTGTGAGTCDCDGDGEAECYRYGTNSMGVGSNYRHGWKNQLHGNCYAQGAQGTIPEETVTSTASTISA